MPELFLISAVLVLVGLAAGLVLAYLAFLRKAGPNEVIVVSGRGPVRFITGGAGVVVPLFSTWNRLSLEIMTLDVNTPEVYTSQGVPVIVDGVAQIKIKKDEPSLHAAAQSASPSVPRAPYCLNCFIGYSYHAWFKECWNNLTSYDTNT